MKFALIQFGNEESYGLLFVGGELLDFNQEIQYFDGDEPLVEEAVISWKPDFIMFSPMTTFYSKALTVSRTIKACLGNVISVFGGHHAMASPEIIEDAEVDVVVIGPVRGAIEQILDGVVGTIKTNLTTPSDLPFPSRAECYRDIPRMRNRYRKFMLSMLGCPWNCSYCSSSCGHMRSLFGINAHRRYYLSRRPLAAVMDEARDIIQYPIDEIEWVDDDVFAGADVEEWIPRFVTEWIRCIKRPIYVSATSLSVLRASDNVIRMLGGITSAIGLGVQAARNESLVLFNRSWDNHDRMKASYNRLKSFGYSINLQCIVGLPVSDPVEDALDTIKLMQEIGPGSICSCYPLQVYPGTKLEKYCKHEGISLNNACKGDTNSGIPGIQFDPLTTKRLRNICKLATPFVKYGVDEKWMRALIDVDFDEEASRKLSMTRYHDCVVDRLGEEGEMIFEKIIKETKLRY